MSDLHNRDFDNQNYICSFLERTDVICYVFGARKEASGLFQFNMVKRLPELL